VRDTDVPDADSRCIDCCYGEFPGSHFQFFLSFSKATDFLRSVGKGKLFLDLPNIKFFLSWRFKLKRPFALF